MATDELLDALPHTAAGERATWVLKQLSAVASGAALPSTSEMQEQYAPGWLAEVPVAAVLSQLVPLASAVSRIHDEAVPRANEVRALLELSDGQAVRIRCVVEPSPPHRIVFQLVSPAMAPTSYVDCLVKRDGREVHIRDFGGDGPLLLLWHGSGCDVTVWEAMVPYLRSFRVVAQDLPGHGGSALGHGSAADAVSDADALLAELGLGEPLLVGHSLGGWLAFHFAATRPCRALVCLDGPSRLDYVDMGLTADHPGFLADPPDVRADLDMLRSPALMVLCSGSSPAQAEWMAPFRRGLYDHVVRTHPEVRIKWQPTDHMIVLSQPEETAALITRFVLDESL